MSQLVETLKIFELYCVSCELNAQHFLCKYIYFETFLSKNRQTAYEAQNSSLSHFWVTFQQLASAVLHDLLQCTNG